MGNLSAFICLWRISSNFHVNEACHNVSIFRDIGQDLNKTVQLEDLRRFYFTGYPDLSEVDPCYKRKFLHGVTSLSDIESLSHLLRILRPILSHSAL